MSESIATSFAALLPRHFTFSLEHNEHKNNLLTVAQFLDDERIDADWPAGERERAIESNELWLARWYPDAPGRFYTLAASTLEALLTALAKVDA